MVEVQLRKGCSKLRWSAIIGSMRAPIQDDINAYIKSGSRYTEGTFRYLTVDDKLMVIWGMARKWGNKRTARYVGVGIAAVKNYKARMLQDPQGIFEELPLYTQLDSRKYLCRLCRERRPTRAQIMRHIMAHIFPIEIYEKAPLNRVVRPV